MSVPGVAAKNAPIVIPLLAGSLVITEETVVRVAAVCIGLLFGAMWRAASLHSEGKTWREVRRDLVISALIGGANAVLALALVDWFDLGVLFAMAVGVVIGGTGLRALPEIRDALVGMLRRRLLGEDVALIQPRDDDMRNTVKQIRKD